MNFHAHSLGSGEGTRTPLAGTKTPLAAFDPRSRVLCALITALLISSLQSWQALFIGAFVPFILFFCGDVKPLSRTLLKLNLASVFICVFLPLTYPGGNGLSVALMITFKLNLISVVTVRMIGPLGMELGGVLESLRFPRKLSVLMILTARYIFLLAERVETMTRAVRLRAPVLSGALLCRSFACMLGTTLIHSSDRAERSTLAMECRGGMEGFFQQSPSLWRVRDTALCIFFAAYAFAVTFWGKSF